MGIAASRGGGETGIPVGGSPAASSSVRLCGRAQTTRRSRTHRIDSGCGRVLRVFLHKEVRRQGVGSNCVAIIADDGRRGVYFQFPLREEVAKSSQAVVVRKSLDYREFCTVAAVVGYRQPAESMQCSHA